MSPLSAYKPCSNSRQSDLFVDRWRRERFAHPGVLSASAHGEMASAMPSQRYYRERARTLLAWSKATKDKAYAAHLRLRAANELEQAEQARGARQT